MKHDPVLGKICCRKGQFATFCLISGIWGGGGKYAQKRSFFMQEFPILWNIDPVWGRNLYSIPCFRKSLVKVDPHLWNFSPWTNPVMPHTGVTKYMEVPPGGLVYLAISKHAIDKHGTNNKKHLWPKGRSNFKMSYLYQSNALVPQGKANVEKGHWWQWYPFLFLDYCHQ